MGTKILIAIVGLPASGKSTAIESVAHFGPVIIMGDVIREEAIRQSKDPGLVAKQLRDQYGEDIVAQRCIEKIRLLKESVIFIDGIRSEREVERFREYWSLYIIAITCPNEVRFQRILNRKRSDDRIELDKIQERDKRELGFGLGSVIEHANYTILNTGSIESLQKKVRTLVQGLI